MSAIAFMTGGVGGTTKKFAFAVAYQLGYAVGNIIGQSSCCLRIEYDSTLTGPQTYRDSDSPQYYTAKYTMLAFLITSALLLAAIGLTHRMWNIRRDRRMNDNPDESSHLENEEFADFTDFQLSTFRYPT